jgi:hypothetical protein
MVEPEAGERFPFPMGTRTEFMSIKNQSQGKTFNSNSRLNTSTKIFGAILSELHLLLCCRFLHSSLN